jgi:hypothetical protein
MFEPACFFAGWMAAARRHRCAIRGPLANTATERSRPLRILPRSGAILPSTGFRFTAPPRRRKDRRQTTVAPHRGPRVFLEARTLPGWQGSRRGRAPFRARAGRAGARGEAHARGLCEGLRQGQQDRMRCMPVTSIGNRRRCRTGRAIRRSAGAPCWSMRRAPIWPDPASSRPKAAATSMSWPRSKRTVLALPDLARAILRPGVERLNDTQAKVRQIETTLAQWYRTDRASKLLATVPGGGLMGASAIRATVCDPSLFRPGREFAAWRGGKTRIIQRAS